MIYVVYYEPLVRNVHNVRLKLKVQKYYGWLFLGENVFLIATNDNLRISAMDLKTDLSKACAIGDKLFITTLGDQTVWTGMGDDMMEWLTYYSKRTQTRNSTLSYRQVGKWQQVYQNIPKNFDGISLGKNILLKQECNNSLKNNSNQKFTN